MPINPDRRKIVLIAIALDRLRATSVMLNASANVAAMNVSSPVNEGNSRHGSPRLFGVGSRFFSGSVAYSARSNLPCSSDLMMRTTVVIIMLIQSFAPGVRGGQDMTTIFPEALSTGDTITVVAPARPLDLERVQRATKRLEEMGYNVQIPADLYRKRGYLAGPDDVRAKELMAAFGDPKVKAIFAGGCGYGSTRLLDRLDYDRIRQNPKILIGFSDITALHLAIHQKTGLVTFHGPLLVFGLGSEENLSAFSADYMWRALTGNRADLSASQPASSGWSYDQPQDADPIKVISPGVARGRLTGGNISLIGAMMGTEFEIETAGRILFLEEAREEPYRIDRYLSGLRLAGKLDGLAGVILGTFTKCGAEDGRNSLTLEEVFDDYFKPLGVPVIMNFPAGHFRYNATLPIGVLTELDAGRRQIRLLENPVRPPSLDRGKAATTQKRGESEE